MPPSRRANLALLLLVGLGLGVYWAWIARPDPPVDASTRFAAHEYYPLLVAGWLQGRLDLPLDAAPGLLALPDPHDPAANAPYRYAGAAGVHDLSLYQGRLYMYWGPAPALLAFLPWRLLTGSGLDASWAVWAFVVAGWLFSARLLLQLGGSYFPQAGLAARIAVILVAGMGNCAFAVLHRPSVYEVAIAAAYACMSLAWWQLAAGLGRPPAARRKFAAIASLAFGLAVAARPSWGVAWPILLTLLWDGSWRPHRKLAACALGPALACLLGLLLYNYARFDDPLEFGARHQLTSDRPPEAFFAWEHVPASVVSYLFAPPQASDYFPFLSATTRVTPAGRRLENAFGIMPLVPVLGAVVLLPLAWRARAVRGLITALATGFLAMLGLLAAFHYGVVLRYALDLAPTLALLAGLGLLAGAQHWQAERSRRVFRALWALGLALTCALSLFAACALRPELSAPALARLEYWANAVAFRVGWSPDSALHRLELNLVLPDDDRAQPVEVIAATGTSPQVNFLYLRRLGGGALVIGFKGADVEAVESAPLALDLAVPHTLALELGSFYPPPAHPYWQHIANADSLRSRVHVELDGVVVLDRRVQQWGAADAAPVLGYLPRESGGSHRFSGALRRGKEHWVGLK